MKDVHLFISWTGTGSSSCFFNDLGLKYTHRLKSHKQDSIPVKYALHNVIFQILTPSNHVNRQLLVNYQYFKIKEREKPKVLGVDSNHN